MLTVSALRKRFGDTVALDGFDLTVSSGEIVGLVGHNGAGKTSFARAVASLLDLDGGRVYLGGREITRRRRAAGQLGLAPQELALFPTSAMENLRYFGRLYGLSARALTRRIAELGEGLALTELLHKPVHALSGGQQRRLHAAVAMLHRPPVLILDEPTVGADPVTRELLLGTVRQAAADGAAVVYATHYLPELDVLDSTLAVAEHGRIIARGSRSALLARLPGRVVLTFDGPPQLTVVPDPQVDSSTVDGNEVVITASDPAAAAARLLAGNVEQARRLQSISLSPPDLDDLYRALLVDHAGLAPRQSLAQRGA
jgi:ABC-2 type transport system ATP-binding protein